MTNEEIKIFKRLSFKERGHFSNYPTFFPVQEIKIAKEFISLKVGAKEFRYKWSEIKLALLKYSAVWKSYGRYAGAKIKTRLFILYFPGRVFKFDLSKQFPDFMDKDDLLNELRKHLNIREEYYVPVWSKFQWLLVAIFLGLFIVSKKQLISSELSWFLFLIFLFLSCMELKMNVKSTVAK